MFKKVMSKAAEAAKAAASKQKTSAPAAAPRGMAGAMGRAVSAAKKSGVATPDSAKSAPPKGMGAKVMAMAKRGGLKGFAKGGAAKKDCK